MEINDKKYCVYIHINEINGKMYVGQTCCSIMDRWENGFGYLGKKNGRYNQPLFANAILKYGWDSFEHIIVYENLSLEEANLYEEWLIYLGDTTNPKYGYNILSGGKNSKRSEDYRKRLSESRKGEKNHRYGMHCTEETKMRISESHKGKYVGEKNPMYGKHHTEETRKRLSETHKNPSEETRRKISENHADVSGANNPRAVCVMIVETREIFKTIQEAADYFHVSRSIIYNLLDNEDKIINDFHLVRNK